MKSIQKNRSSCNLQSTSDVKSNYHQVWQSIREPYKSPFIRTKPEPVSTHITATVTKVCSFIIIHFYKEPKSGKKIYPELDYKRQTPNLIAHNEKTVAQYQKERPITAFVSER